jgi:replicative DNA helicase
LLADDFFVQRHKLIYQAILDLHERGEPADLVTLTDELERREQLSTVGGAAFLTSLINATPTSIHVEYYGRIVERTAILRRLIDTAGQITRMAYQDVDDVDEVVDQAESLVFSVSERRTTRDLVPIQQLLNQYYARIEYLSEHPQELIGVPTGLVDLDKMLGGFQRSDLIIIAGRPGMGKTSLALSIALQAALKWATRVGIFSLEMSSEQVVQRLISAQSGIDSQRLRLGDIHDDEWLRFNEVAGQLSKTQIFIDDTPALSAMEMRTKARRLHAEHGLDLLIVDYLQLMRGGDFRGESNRVQEISYISRALKALARELNIPLIALSQLSRAVEARHDKRPVLSDLRESGSIEQDADVVLMIYRDDVYNPDTEIPNIAEIRVAKHRSGPTGILSAYFKKELAKFIDVEVRREPLQY